MENIYKIMKDVLGVEVPADKKADFDSRWKENYRTKEEFDKAVQKRDEYKQSLDEVQEKLDGFKDVDVNDLKNQVSTLTQNLADEKAGREADARKVELERNVDSFLAATDEKGNQKRVFVNEITQKSIRDSLLAELDKDTAKGKSIDDIFTGLISDKDGKQMPNILVDAQLEKGKARFTGKLNQPGGGGAKYSMSELMKMANEGVDVSQYMEQ